MMLSVVDNEEKLRAFYPILDDMVQQGLVVLSDVDIIKYTHDYQEVGEAQGGRAMKLAGKAKMLRIHFGEDDKWKDKPLYRAIVEKCRELDIAGATVFRGVAGYGAIMLIHRLTPLLLIGRTHYGQRDRFRGQSTKADSVSG